MPFTILPNPHTQSLAMASVGIFLFFAIVRWKLV